ncbi:hypothetical protein M885DRAFT_615173 [Pelagophyceae sp. CCMP2097]|nr:hypothetical protein M885DRAFT_615173 [Pelagophyceae sp. CCMP2097]
MGMFDAEPLDFEALAKLGLLDDDDAGAGDDGDLDEDDPALLALLAEAQGGGDDFDMDSLEAEAEAFLNGGGAAPGSDDEPDGGAPEGGQGAATGGPARTPRAAAAPPAAATPEEDGRRAERVAALKQEALALKKAGDLDGALKALRKAKALERGEAFEKDVSVALDRVAQVVKPHAERWLALAEALQAATKAAAAEAKRLVLRGDRETANDVTQRARELRTMFDAATMRAGSGERAPPCPGWSNTTVVSRERVVDADVPAECVCVEVRGVSVALSTENRSKWPKHAQVRWELTGVTKELVKGQTAVVPLVPSADGKSVLEAAFSSMTRVALDPKLVDASARSRRGDALTKDDRAVLQKLDGRGKLAVEVELTFASGLFRRRAPEVLRLRAPLDALAAANTLATADVGTRLKGDAEDSIVQRRAAQASRVDCALRLREPLKSAEFAECGRRADVDVPDYDFATAPLPAAVAPPAAAPPPAAKAVRAPPAAEQLDPHAPALCVSDKVLEHELAACGAGDDLATSMRRLALETAAAILVGDVQSGKLTMEAHAARVRSRRGADVVLATWLRHQARTDDALRVLQRIKLADAELAELDDMT